MNGLVLIVAALALAYFWSRGSLNDFLRWFHTNAQRKPKSGEGTAGGGGGGSW